MFGRLPAATAVGGAGQSLGGDVDLPARHLPQAIDDRPGLVDVGRVRLRRLWPALAPGGRLAVALGVPSRIHDLAAVTWRYGIDAHDPILSTDALRPRRKLDVIIGANGICAAALSRSAAIHSLATRVAQATPIAAEMPWPPMTYQGCNSAPWGAANSRTAVAPIGATRIGAWVGPSRARVSA